MLLICLVKRIAKVALRYYGKRNREIKQGNNLVLGYRYGFLYWRSVAAGNFHDQSMESVQLAS